MLRAGPWRALDGGRYDAIRTTLQRRVSHDARPTSHSGGVLQPRPQPTITDEAGHKTLRVRQHGNRNLPLPPLLDPIAVEARGRHKQAKPESVKDNLTTFQKQLAANPYAQALATPVRLCSVSNVRVPSHFLQPFAGVFSPSTTDQDRIHAKVLPRTRALRKEAGHDTVVSNSSSYMLSRQSFLQTLSKGKQWTVLVSMRMREAYDRIAAGRKVLSDRKLHLQWDHDSKMADTVLVGLRDEVVEAIRKVMGRKDGSIHVPDVEALNSVANVRSVDTSGASQTKAISTTEKPSEDATQFSVYNLQDLLSPEQLSDLPGVAAAGRGLALPHNHKTMKLHLALLRLGDYVGHQQPVEIHWVGDQKLDTLQPEAQVGLATQDEKELGASYRDVEKEFFQS